MSNDKKYKVTHFKSKMAFLFKIGKYTTSEEFDKSPIKGFHFTIEEDTLVSVCAVTRSTMFGNDYQAWLIYSESVRGTWLSDKSPDKIEWLIPFYANCPKIWSELNN